MPAFWLTQSPTNQCKKKYLSPGFAQVTALGKPKGMIFAQTSFFYWCNSIIYISNIVVCKF